MNQRFKDKVVVITGGGSGIGFAAAQRFIEEGAHVFIFGRRQEMLNEAVNALRKNITAIQGDVSKQADVKRLYASVKATKGKVDMIFANAAFMEVAVLGEITEEHIDKTYGTNLKGIIFTVQEALPLLSNKASIVLTASVGAYKGFPGQTVSASSKAAIRSLARVWAAELKDKEVRVNLLSPGVVDTERMREFFANDEAQKFIDILKASTPLGRLGTAKELANAAVFLASDEASFINGTELQVDGGLTQV